jgi:hypothetical protein
MNLGAQPDTTALRGIPFTTETIMHDQNLEVAERLFVPARPDPIIGEYVREQLALHASRDRLPSERMAREAAEHGRR